MTGAALAQEPFVFGNGKVSVLIPDKFNRMPKEMVDQKYPRGTAPEYVFSNAKTTVSIAASYKPGEADQILQFAMEDPTVDRTPLFAIYQAVRLEVSVGDVDDDFLDVLE